jgi:hypothetical protein
MTEQGLVRPVEALRRSAVPLRGLPTATTLRRRAGSFGSWRSGLVPTESIAAVTWARIS